MSEASDLFEKIYSRGRKEVGYSIEEIEFAEKKLGTKLPTQLRNFYLTQVGNSLINSCHNFARPENLHIENSKWLVFYGENQGIWGCAFDLEESNSENLKVYVSYEQQGYEEEAKNFKDFFIVRAACDYGEYIYPYRMRVDDVEKSDLDTFLNKLDNIKSDISPPNYYFRRRLFWENEDEVIRVFEASGRDGRRSVVIQSLDKDCFERYQSLNENIRWNENLKWNVLPQGEIKSADCESFVMTKEEYQKKINNQSYPRSENFELPF